MRDEPGSWNTMPTFARSGFRSLCFAPRIVMPSMVMWPEWTGSSPTTARPIVVFPEPDSPTSPTTSPRLMDIVTPSTARNAGVRPRLGYSSTMSWVWRTYSGS